MTIALLALASLNLCLNWLSQSSFKEQILLDFLKAIEQSFKLKFISIGEFIAFITAELTSLFILFSFRIDLISLTENSGSSLCDSICRYIWRITFLWHDSKNRTKSLFTL